MSGDEPVFDAKGRGMAAFTERNGLISSETISKVVHTIVEHFNPVRIVLFGSYASGNPDPDSDLDLLIVMPSSLPRYKRALPIRMLFRPAPCSMDILVYTPEEVDHWMGTVNHIVTNALQSGRILHERA
ncbi:MAG: nucleotidyltransferase domain-containing protein [Magnetococcales bacterium]|nr:nucleotidyltransferase domain-containing protein [Magnetococcales bacterium]MBF0347434.1 nucleotidyltransferase domain-containing protein [Magnetococcales bacterium]MBF0629446.1 nucleotidyltransferase domain-containing protein [Magnetococcales bacterium]